MEDSQLQLDFQLSTINFEEYADLFNSDDDDFLGNFDMSGAKRFEHHTEEDIANFIADQENENTRKKTTGDLKLFKLFLRESLEYREPEKLPADELSPLIARFLLSARKKDGSDYEPSTLRGFFSSIDRYLRQHNYGYSLVSDSSFSVCREALKSKQKQLKSEGKGNKPQAADELDDNDINQLYKCGQLGIHSPQALVNMLWMINMTFFGMRGGVEQHNLKWGDIKLEMDAEGRRYLIYTQERQTKTRTGQNPRDMRKVKPRAYETPSEPNKCPVLAYIEYSKRRPQAMMGPDDAFFLSVNDPNPSSGQTWFKRQNMGINKLYNIMKTMKLKGNISADKRLTNHSARKHLIQKLNDNNVPPNHIIQISGHKNLNSVNNYSTLNPNQQANISQILSNTTPASTLVRPVETIQHSSPASVPVLPSSQSTSNTLTRQYSHADTHTMFQGCTFNNSVVKVYCHRPSTSSELSPPPKYRRILPLPELDDSQ